MFLPFYHTTTKFCGAPSVAANNRAIPVVASARAQRFVHAVFHSLAHKQMHLEITQWAEWVQFTGVQFVSLINAAQLASCCGATLRLPSRYVFGLAKHTRFTFASPEGNASFCKSVRGTSDVFFYKHIPWRCRTLHHRSQAYHAANEYAELPQKCSDTRAKTVAHVRTLDMDPSKAVHSEYGQPPLSFYLRAWKHTRDETLHVVHKDLSSPVAKVLDTLHKTTNMAIKMHSHVAFKRDLLILLCAENLIMSRSSLSVMVLMNPRLKRVYHYEQPREGPWRLLSYSCDTAHFHAGGNMSRWVAADHQKLELVTNDPPLAFVRAKTTCLEPRGS